MGKKNKKPNRGMIAQWGITAVILFVVVLIMVSKFSVSSEENAKTATYNQFMTEASTYALRLHNNLNGVMSAGKGLVAAIEAEGQSVYSGDSLNEEKLSEYASYLVSRLSSVYLVAITDRDGTGITSNGTSVNLSQRDYYYNGALENYTYTSSDGITERSAFVIAVPYHIDGEIAGNVYLFTDPDEIMGFLPKNNYGGGVSFAIIAVDGSIVTRTGNNSFFTSNENLFDNLNTATISDMSLSSAKLKIEKGEGTAFAVKKDEEARTIVTASVGVQDWTLIIAMNQKHVNTVLNSALSDGRTLVVELAITTWVFIVMLVVMVLISKLKYGEENKDLADKADTDLLTELNNKIATERKIQEFMNENPDSQCLMFLFDIDNFKKINDTMGHAFGDEVLRTLGHSLRNEFRVTDIIGRLGGDEFVLFLKNIKSDEQLEREGVRITNFFHQFKAGDYVKYSATASIGAVVFPRDATDFQSAYQAADKALYEAKRRGKNQLVFYNQNMENVESIRVTDDIDSDK